MTFRIKMALVHPNSCECTKSELDLFEVPPGLWVLGAERIDIGRDVAACLIFIPCTTSPAIFNLVFKASRSRVCVPFFNKGMAALKSPDDDTALDGGADLSTYGCIPSLVMSVLASTKIWFHYRPACTLTELT
jgi:hypothetical protein